MSNHQNTHESSSLQHDYADANTHVPLPPKHVVNISTINQKSSSLDQKSEQVPFWLLNVLSVDEYTNILNRVTVEYDLIYQRIMELDSRRFQGMVLVISSTVALLLCTLIGLSLIVIGCKLEKITVLVLPGVAIVLAGFISWNMLTYLGIYLLINLHNCIQSIQLETISNTVHRISQELSEKKSLPLELRVTYCMTGMIHRDITLFLEFELTKMIANHSPHLHPKHLSPQNRVDTNNNSSLYPEASGTPTTVHYPIIFSSAIDLSEGVSSPS